MAVKIPVNLILSDFQRMYREHWSYVWGAARNGCVDCSGAFVYSYKIHGNSIYHGSNRIARVYVEKLMTVDYAKSNGLLVPGLAALKFRKPGQNNYDLPSQYKNGGKYYNGDLNDYYHIGLVDQDTNYVLNAQGESTGFVRSPITQNWNVVAKLKAVEYSGGDPMPSGKTAIVTAPSGSTVNMREQMSTSSKIIEKVPIGSTVTVLNDLGNWCNIQHNNKTGYMVSNYLEYTDAPVDENDFTVDKNELTDIYNRLGKIYMEIGAMLGSKG